MLRTKEVISLTEERKKHLKRLYFKTLAITLAVCIGLMGAGYGVFAYMVGGLNRSDINEENLSANEGIERNVASSVGVYHRNICNGHNRSLNWLALDFAYSYCSACSK